MVRITFELDQEMFIDATEEVVRMILKDAFKMYNSFKEESIRIEDVSGEWGVIKELKEIEQEDKIIKKFMSQDQLIAFYKKHGRAPRLDEFELKDNK